RHLRNGPPRHTKSSTLCLPTKYRPQPLTQRTSTVKPVRLFSGLLAFGGILLFGPSLVRADDWPAWRGPENNGICKETGLAGQWGEKNNIAWKLPLPGKAGSTPVVWKDRIFLTSAEGQDLVLLCVGTDSQQRWKRKLGTAGRTNIKKGEANEASS